jgi:hypothetical protein
MKDSISNWCASVIRKLGSDQFWMKMVHSVVEGSCAFFSWVLRHFSVHLRWYSTAVTNHLAKHRDLLHAVIAEPSGSGMFFPWNRNNWRIQSTDITATQVTRTARSSVTHVLDSACVFFVTYRCPLLAQLLTKLYLIILYLKHFKWMKNKILLTPWLEKYA